MMGATAEQMVISQLRELRHQIEANAAEIISYLGAKWGITVAE